MRKLALALPLALLSFSCSSFTWKGQAATVSPDQAERGIMDIAALQSAYETEKYWADWGRRRDGLVNSFSRGLDNVMTTVDRHFLNYSATDPAVNYPTNGSHLTSVAGFAGNTFLGATFATVGTGAK